MLNAISAPAAPAPSAAVSALVEAFGRTHRNKLVCRAADVCGWGHAEDALQEAFLAMWKKAEAGDITEVGNPAGMAYTFTRFHSLRQLYSTARQREATLADEPKRTVFATRTTDPAARYDEPDVPMEALERRAELSWMLAEALSMLPPLQRAAVMALYAEGRTGADAASLLGKTEGSVRTSAYIGLRRLRQYFAEREAAPVA